jgi:hypothetical protein
MKAKILLSICLAVYGWCPLWSQAGFSISDGQKQIDIPFEFYNNFIILTVQFNRMLPLKFIYDTGAENTILSKREVSDLLNVRYERTFTVRGSDLKTMLTAYLARQIRLEIMDKVVAPSEDILVLQEDYFRFEEYAGVNIHGILAGNIFSKYIVKINYQKKLISLYQREGFKVKDASYVPVPIEIYRNKIYLFGKLQMFPDSIAEIKLMMDTGAGLSMMLLSNTHPMIQPPSTAIPTNIGMGLGGYLEGFTGRVYNLSFETLSQKNVVTYFQSLDSSVNLDYLNGRNGLLGNMVLSRFHIIIDYQNAKMWMKPGKGYDKIFDYDRSGISLIASGLHLNTFTVQSVMQNSPAEAAGLQKGDEIIRVGISPAAFLSLVDIQRSFQKAPGKKIKIVIKRNGEKMRKVLILRNLI